MRDDPYPARYYGRQIDEPFLRDVFATLPGESPGNSAFPLPQPLPRVLLLLMMLYLCSALFLIFTVTSYAAPLRSATIHSSIAAPCVETATVAKH